MHAMYRFFSRHYESLTNIVEDQAQASRVQAEARALGIVLLCFTLFGYVNFTNKVTIELFIKQFIINSAKNLLFVYGILLPCSLVSLPASFNHAQLQENRRLLLLDNQLGLAQRITLLSSYSNDVHLLLIAICVGAAIGSFDDEMQYSWNSVATELLTSSTLCSVFFLLFSAATHCYALCQEDQQINLANDAPNNYQAINPMI